MDNKTKFCSYCGNEIPLNVTTCPKCGNNLNNNSENNVNGNANNNKTKCCKKCKRVIGKYEKKCPYCGANQKKPFWTIFIVVVVIIIIASSGSNDSDNSNSSSNVNNNSKNNVTNTTPEVIDYIVVSKDDLDDELDNNAALARDKYNGKYVEVSGSLGTIDSELKYISLYSSTKEYDFVGIHCRIKNTEQKDIIKTLTKGQDITIRGKITDVGEVLGYYLDIIEIIAN